MKCGLDASWQEWCNFACCNHSLSTSLHLNCGFHNCFQTSTLHPHLLSILAKHTHRLIHVLVPFEEKSRCESQMETMTRKLEDWDIALSRKLQLSVPPYSQIQIKGQNRENEKYSRGLMCLSIVFPKSADQFIDNEKEDRKREKETSLLRNKKLGKITFFLSRSKQYWLRWGRD